MDSIDRLSLDVVQEFRAAVLAAEGQEVCAAGRLDSEGTVASIVITARGNESAVPALLPHLERGDVVIHNHPSGRLRPSEPDLTIASHLGNLGIGFYIVDNTVDRIYVVAEPVAPRQRVALDVEELQSHLLPGGSLSRVMASYEIRDAQLEMVDRVARAFNGDSICVVEAGTGVGKSVAYLLPAIRWAEQNEERIVISTATINLQQQLVEKDIPLVTRLLGSEVKSALVKGRGNYLCLRNLDLALSEESMFDERDEELASITEWSHHTADGSRSDLAFVPNERTWSRVSSDADSCVGLRCSFRERCFVLSARRAAAAAQILVVNHHLLFSDLSMRLSGVGFENTAVLPPFQRIIFDEAHNIEANATSYFSEEMSRVGISRQIGRLYRRRRGRVLGLVLAFARLVRRAELVDEVASLAGDIEERAALLDTLSTALLSQGGTLRLSPPLSQEVKTGIVEPMRELQLAIVALTNRIGDLMAKLDANAEESSEAYEIRIVLQRLLGYSALCETFRHLDEENERIFWVERRRLSSGDVYAGYVVTPLDVSRLMRESVFEPYRTVVCTSATLTVRNDFGFWLGRVGLRDYATREVDTNLFPSPFPYEERVLVAVPTDSPEPASSLFPDYAANLIADILETSEGSGLVLFTSYAMLADLFERVQPRLGARGIPVLKQGDDDRRRLLNRFTNDVASVLFATDSFWEGVDAPGETLRVVIICRLPFRVPTDPIVTARMEAIDRQGRSSFVEYALPTAIMRFKQGFGRLMRKQSDHGVVAILDSRIVRKSYGGAFFDSLPRTQRSLKPGSAMLEDLERFLYAPNGTTPRPTDQG